MAGALDAAEEAGVDYLIFGGMTLKQGRQSGHFLDILGGHHPELLPKYRRIYRGERWGQAAGQYYPRLCERFRRIAQRYRIPLRMPPELFNDLLDDKDRVVVILDQMDYLLRLGGKASAYRRAARAVARWEGLLEELVQPAPELLDSGREAGGLNAKARSLIREILQTGTAREHEQLLRNKQHRGGSY